MKQLKHCLSFNSFLAATLLSLPAISMADSYQGELEVLYVDYFNPSKAELIYQLKDKNGQSKRLDIPSKLVTDALQTGAYITIEGTERKQKMLTKDSESETDVIFVEGITVQPAHEKLNFNATNERNAIVMMVDFNDKKASDITSIASIDSMMYSGTKSTDQIYNESSFGKVRFVSDTDGDGVSDIFHITLDYDAGSSCDYNQWANDAEQAVQDMGADLSLYQHRVTVLSNQVGCGWGGLGYLGCGTYCRAWVKWHSTIVYAHELGHNLRMHHASTDPENDGTTNSEYGDHSGIMGNNSTVRQVNGPHRIQLDWYSDLPDQFTEVTESTSLPLYPLEVDPTQTTTGLQVIAIPKQSGSDKYYLTYRKNMGTFGMGSTYRDKVNVHRFSGGATKTAFIKALSTGGTFEDADNGILVTVLDAGGDKANVQITIGQTDPTTTIQGAAFLGAHNSYLVAENNGGGDVNANRSAVGSWETFNITLESSDQDPGCIQNGDHVSVNTQGGYYLTATQGGLLNANATAVSATETFTIISDTNPSNCLQTGDEVGLKSSFDLYMVAEGDGTANANRTWMKSWERFTLSF